MTQSDIYKTFGKYCKSCISNKDHKECIKSNKTNNFYNECYIEWLEKKVDEYRIKYKTSNVRYEMLVRSLQAIVLDGKKYLLNKNKIEDKKE